MMTCDSFRARFHPGIEDAAALAHLRTCDRCLDLAAHSDPDVMFRAIGGTDMVPPGGLDAFVDGVMQQVRVRGAESAVESNVVSWPRRMAMAAAVGLAVFGATLVMRTPQAATPAAVHTAAVRHTVQPVSRTLTTKPVVETYESANATIVEMPTEESDDVKIVMVFDDKLPADL